MKLHVKIIKACLKIAEKENIQLRQTYVRTVKKLIFLQRGKKSPKGRKIALKAQRQIKTIAGRLLRELWRKLSESALLTYADDLKLFESILGQTRESKNKTYSIHEKETYCISKGKEHKPYEFGTKVSIAITNKSGMPQK